MEIITKYLFLILTTLFLVVLGAGIILVLSSIEIIKKFSRGIYPVEEEYIIK